MDEKKKMNKKSIVIGLTSLLLVTLLLLGLTYAYYKTKIVGNSNEKSVSVVSKNLSVTYQNESAVINAEGIEPGYTATKTFEVKNTGSETVEYSVMLDNVTNTFTRTEDWTYTISVGGTTLKEGTLPNTTSYILYSENIDAGETKNYTLVINYVYLEDVDQSDDMGASLSFRINISNSLGTTLTSASEGTLLYAINRDNVVSEPLTVPGNKPFVKYGEEFLSDNLLVTVLSTYDSQYGYVVYGTGYTFDEITGLYTLTGVTTTTDTYANSYSELEGKYVAYSGYGSISATTKENALNKTTSGLTKIYKIGSTTSTSYAFQEKKGAVLLESEAVLASTEDDYGTSYYYRGAVKNNYVNYSGMCWRIVRVQGNGTIKLTLADENGVCDSDTYNTKNNNAVIGGSQEQYNNTIFNILMTGESSELLFENSDVLSTLKSWASILDTSKLVETEWCNDTAKTSVVGNVSYYGAYDRTNPTLKCNTKGIEGTTGIEAKAQKYVGKIALLTADEVRFAGLTISYLSDNLLDASYWIMTPYYSELFSDFYTDNNVENKVYIASSGSLDAYWTQSTASVRPVVVLNSNVEISSGNGTQTNPYVIS